MRYFYVTAMAVTSNINITLTVATILVTTTVTKYIINQESRAENENDILIGYFSDLAF